MGRQEIKRDLERHPHTIVLTTVSLQSPLHLQLDQDPSLQWWQQAGSVSTGRRTSYYKDCSSQEVRWGPGSGWHTNWNQSHFFWVIVTHFQCSNEDDLNKMTQLESNIARMQTKENWPQKMWSEPPHCHNKCKLYKMKSSFVPSTYQNLKADTGRDSIDIYWMNE